MGLGSPCHLAGRSLPASCLQLARWKPSSAILATDGFQRRLDWHGQPLPRPGFLRPGVFDPHCRTFASGILAAESGECLLRVGKVAAGILPAGMRVAFRLTERRARCPPLRSPVSTGRIAAGGGSRRRLEISPSWRGSGGGCGGEISQRRRLSPPAAHDVRVKVWSQQPAARLRPRLPHRGRLEGLRDPQGPAEALR